MIEVICGPMFSGKTEELMRRVTRAKIAGLTINVYKHSSDDERYGSDLMTHGRQEMAAMSLDIWNFDPRSGVDIMAIDEIQWFDVKIVRKMREWSIKGLRVIVAGLDMDFRGQPISQTMNLALAVADKVTKLKAVCMSCGQDAGYSHRLGTSKSLMKIGGKEEYEARCHRCFFSDSDPKDSVSS